VRDVEFSDEQVVVLSDRVGHGIGVAAGSDHRVSGGESGLNDVDAHPAPSASDEPNLLVSDAPQSSRR
jgi:hypothetical protein